MFDFELLRSTNKKEIEKKKFHASLEMSASYHIKITEKNACYSFHSNLFPFKFILNPIQMSWMDAFHSNCIHWIICLYFMTFYDNIFLSEKGFHFILMKEEEKKKNVLKRKNNNIQRR